MCFGEIHVDTNMLDGDIVRAKLLHGAMSIEQGMDLIRSFKCSTIDGCHKDRKRRSWIFKFSHSQT